MWQQIWNWLSLFNWEYFSNRQICSLKCDSRRWNPVDVTATLRVCGEMMVAGGGFWSSWYSGWTHSVWTQTDIFDCSGSFLPIITGDFCTSPPSLLPSLICSQLPTSLPAEGSGGPVEPTGASSHGPDTLAQARSHRIRHLNVSLWTLKDWDTSYWSETMNWWASSSVY